MTDKQMKIDGCEFQSDCIEYKDISYLKIMPICAIHELSIACHDKVNKCKYYKLYKQLAQAENQIAELNKMIEAKEQECEELKKQLIQKDEVNTFFNTLDWNSAPCEICPKKNCLNEIEGIVNFISNITNCDKAYYCKDKLDEIIQKISEVIK